MTAAITPTSKMLTLARREFQEQRIMFFYLPLLICLMVTVTFAVVALRSYIMDFHFIGLIGNRTIAETPQEIAMALQSFSEMPMEFRTRFWEQFYTQTLPLQYIGLWGVLFYYFQMTLYSQRADRSILFWNSMPVSNTETIISKLLAGYVLCHAIWVAFLFVFQIMMMLVMMAYMSQFDVSVWDNVVVPSGIIGRFAYLFSFTFLAIFWSLPVYAWLLLTSAWTKSAPFAWSMAPIVILVLFEVMFISTRADVLRVFFEHAFPVAVASGTWSDFELTSKFFSGEMLVSILLGVAFIYGAIRLNRSEES